MRAVAPGVRLRARIADPFSSLIEKRRLDGEGHHVAPDDIPEQFRKSRLLTLEG